MDQSQLKEVGRCAGAYGVRGWIRVIPHAREGELLFEVDTWYRLPYPRRAGVAAERLTVLEVKPHGKEFLVRVQESTQKEAADALKGSLLVDRDDLPQLEDGDFYDDDLLGLSVINRQGQTLGTVAAVANNGAQDMLEVAPEQDPKKTFFIPMVDQFIDEIDFDEEVVKVDWQSDWL